MKTLLPLLVLLFAAVCSDAQARFYTHTISTGDGTTTYKTVCTGGYYTSCTTTETTETASAAYDRAVYEAKLKALCTDMNAAYGKNLERYSEPIGSPLVHCIKDKKLRSQIINSNWLMYKAGGKPESMNPLYKGPNAAAPK